MVIRLLSARDTNGGPAPCCHVRLAGCDLRYPQFMLCNMSAWNQTVVCFLPEEGNTLFGRKMCGVRILCDMGMWAVGRVAHIQTTTTMTTRQEVMSDSCPGAFTTVPLVSASYSTTPATPCRCVRRRSELSVGLVSLARVSSLRLRSDPLCCLTYCST